jgi:hypothetical protein
MSGPGGGRRLLPTATLEADLSIGSLEGESREVFGDVRGIDADPDGSIYVLDFQSREIQVFDPDGDHLRTLGGPGDGPGELTAANGLLMDPEGILWVNDHGKMRFLGLQPDGTELARIPFPVQSYGFIWEGMRDREGRFWMPAPQRDAPMTRPEGGLNESEARVYMKSIHPETGAVDSVYVGRTTSRSFVVPMAGGGQAFFPVPFDPLRAIGLDPEGGFWRSQGEEYRITRLDARGREGTWARWRRASTPTPTGPPPFGGGTRTSWSPANWRSRRWCGPPSRRYPDGGRGPLPFPITLLDEDRSASVPRHPKPHHVVHPQIVGHHGVEIVAAEDREDLARGQAPVHLHRSEVPSIRSEVEEAAAGIVCRP